MNLYFALYYFVIVLTSTTGHVMIAANVEDFRTIAKKFFPENILEVILEMAEESLARKNITKLIKNHEFRNELVADITKLKNYNTQATERLYHKGTRELKSKSDKTERITSKYNITLNELVHKVTERLIQKLTNMSATTKGKNTRQKPFLEPKPLTSSSENSLEFQNGKSPFRYAKETTDEEEIEIEKGAKKHTPDDKYVPKMFATHSLQYMSNQGKPYKFVQNNALRLDSYEVSTRQHQLKNKETDKQDRKPAPVRRLTSTMSSLVTYQDAVTTEKDEYYKVPEKKVPYKTAPASHDIDSDPQDEINKKILQLFSDETEKTSKSVDYDNYEDKTTNYNKKTKTNKYTRTEEIINNRGNEYQLRVVSREFVAPAIPFSLDNFKNKLPTSKPSSSSVDKPTTIELIEKRNDKTQKIINHQNMQANYDLKDSRYDGEQKIQLRERKTVIDKVKEQGNIDQIDTLEEFIEKLEKLSFNDGKQTKQPPKRNTVIDEVKEKGNTGLNDYIEELQGKLEKLSFNNGAQTMQPRERKTVINELKEKGNTDQNDYVEELKQKLEKLSFTKYTVAQYAEPDDEKYVEGNKGKRKVSLISKSDVYKMNNPNYLVELPVVDKKYHSDESSSEENQQLGKTEILTNNNPDDTGRIVLV